MEYEKNLSDPLFLRHEIPQVFWEVGIRSGYRKPHSTVKECLRSALHLNNETLNFWTHFLPFWCFLWTLRHFSAKGDFLNDSYQRPYFAYLVTVCTFPLVSCFAHLFSIMSTNARHICFFVDYLALSWYSFGVAVAYRAYCFDELFFNTWYSVYYLRITAVVAILCMFMSCMTRFVRRSKFRKALRCATFACIYLTVSFPLYERILRCYLVTGCDDASIPLHARQFFWAAAMTTVYATHFPECYMPGRFDFIGHSHQLFHIFGIMASYDQMSAVFVDLEARRSLFDALNMIQDGKNELFLVWVVLLADIIIVLVFIAYLLLYDGAVNDGPSDTCRKSFFNLSSANMTVSDDECSCSLSKIE